MTIPPIESIMPSLPTPEWATPNAAAGQVDFASMIGNGIAEVDRRIQVAENDVATFATGEDIPPHQVMLALEDARMSLQFALQVRSRVVEGFQELMRMQL